MRPRRSDRGDISLADIRLLIESKYAVGATVAGFLLALFLSHGNLMAGVGVLALVAGHGRPVQPTFQRHHEERDNE